MAMASASGTTMTATEIGIVGFPRQPAFSAYATAVNNVTGDNTTYSIINNNEYYDIGSNYNAGTGIFTAPADGLYAFTAVIGISQSSINSSMQAAAVSFQVVGSSLQAGENVCIRNDPYATKGSEYDVNISNQFYLYSGDTVQPSIRINSSTKTCDLLGSGITSFSGVKLA